MGPAADRLKGIKIIDSNYDVAWQRLVWRYDNKQVRLSSQMESLLLLPQVRARNSKDLASLIDSAEVIVQGLTDLGWPIEKCNHFVVHHLRKVLLKLKIFGMLCRKIMRNFLERCLRTMEQRRSVFTQEADAQPSSKGSSRKSAHAVTVNVTQLESPRSFPKTSCAFCKEAHWLFQCDKFKHKTQSGRYLFCKSANLCLNCLGKNHRLSNCPSKKRCRFCSAMHHCFLHAKTSVKADSDGDASQTTSVQRSALQDAVAASTSFAAHASSSTRNVLLTTASVLIANAQGRTMTFRALIDPAVERSFVLESINLVNAPSPQSLRYYCRCRSRRQRKGSG